MKVLELVPSRRVAWECVGGAPEWIGTRVWFDLNEADGESKIFVCATRLARRGRVTKWAVYLVGLKALLETGCGTPYPNDM
jgi:hypothetical protein